MGVDDMTLAVFSGFWKLASGYRSLVTVYWKVMILDTGYSMLDKAIPQFRFFKLSIEYRLAKYWM